MIDVLSLPVSSVCDRFAQGIDDVADDAFPRASNEAFLALKDAR
jgi:hypothetical protein